MLWFKAWRESQSRFGLSAATIAALSVAAVFVSGTSWAAPISRSATYSGQVYDLFYSGTAKGVFALLVVFLAQGGLLREAATGAVFDTLALPVTRAHIVAAQIGVGLTELAVLALLPAGLIPALSPLVHRSYPVLEALHFSVLWFVCGGFIFAGGYLLSTVARGAYTAPTATIIALFLQAALLEWPALRPLRLNILWTMGEFGTMHWDPAKQLLLPGPLPGQRLILLSAVAILFLGCSFRIVDRQDF